MSATSVTSMELASDWEIGTVLNAVQSKDRSALVQFLKVRYEKRFFEPIALLEKEAIRGIPWVKGNPDPKPDPIRPYGFAIMSLACQMIETLESYRRGIPTTNKQDFGWMKKHDQYDACAKCLNVDEKEIPGTEEAFKSFFYEYSASFPGLKGDEFFRYVRNALLHQSQTRNGWKLNVHHPEEALTKVNEVFVATEKILYRDSFVSQLRCCFLSFVQHLAQHSSNDEIWRKPERKIWWIAWLSDQVYAAKWLKDQCKNKGN